MSRREHVMDGRVVLITGAGQRLGAATATRLMDEGCYVLIHVRSSVDSAMSLIEESKARNGEIRGAVLQADLTVEEDVSRLILEVKNHPKVVASGLYVRANVQYEIGGVGGVADHRTFPSSCLKLQVVVVVEPREAPKGTSS